MSTPAVDHTTDAATQRRKELAHSALITLSRVGYAHASLREIATNSPFSHGVVHYYFADKHDLMDACVDLYIEPQVRRYERLDEATTLEELTEGAVAMLRQGVADDLASDRVYFDLRTSALFDPEAAAFADRVSQALKGEITRFVRRYEELSGQQCAWSIDLLQNMLDAIGFEAMRKASAGALDDAANELEQSVRSVIRAAFPA